MTNRKKLITVSVAVLVALAVGLGLFFAIRAYQNAGFSVIGELPGHEWFEGTFVDCLLMEKTLS